MKLKHILILLITSSLTNISICQSETYSIKKAPFSSDKYDEFSPVFYKNGIVFCTNRNTGLTNYSTSADKGLFKIDYIDTSGNVSWQNARLFSKALTTNLNDGPATFNRTGDTVIYSRNLELGSGMRDVSSPRNKLGLFSAVMVNDKWTKIRELRFNNEWYNVTTPCLSPDGKKLYFASDKPGGYGGFDIYYSQWKRDYWGDPINMGPAINTKGNEAYPFINPSGELFFSSDGHPGIGGKDIFFSRNSDSLWLKPVPLDPPINSEYDDFGIITDSLNASGYFSSKRDKTTDIYQFTTNFPQIFYTYPQIENHYCFRFSDSGSIVIDTLYLKYIWDFGDGKKASKAIVNHCYTGPGKYSVKLDLFDKATGKLFFSKLAYDLVLRDFEQPFIKSPNFGVKGEIIDFDGLNSNLPGYKILNYSWDFGDGTRIKGESVKHVFKEEGEYQVNLGVFLRDSAGLIFNRGVKKKITVLNDISEMKSRLSKEVPLAYLPADIGKNKNSVRTIHSSAETDFKNEILFQVELFSSKRKIELNSNLFKNVPKKYTVMEVFDEQTGFYSYIIDQQLTLMATYIAYKELLEYGFVKTRIRIEILKDPAAIELNSLIKLFGTSTDFYFDNNIRLTSNAYLFLDQILKVMTKYPSVSLEIAVHTDNIGPPEKKLQISKYYSQVIVKYLTDKGIEAKRLIAKGYGGARPVTSTLSEKDQSLNRRIDFTIIRK